MNTARIQNELRERQAERERIRIVERLRPMVARGLLPCPPPGLDSDAALRWLDSFAAERMKTSAVALAEFRGKDPASRQRAAECRALGELRRRGWRTDADGLWVSPRGQKVEGLMRALATARRDAACSR